MQAAVRVLLSKLTNTKSPYEMARRTNDDMDVWTNILITEHDWPHISDIIVSDLPKLLKIVRPCFIRRKAMETPQSINAVKVLTDKMTVDGILQHIKVQSFKGMQYKAARGYITHTALKCGTVSSRVCTAAEMLPI